LALQLTNQDGKQLKVGGTLQLVLQAPFQQLACCVSMYVDCRMVCSDTENTIKNIAEGSAMSVPPAEELAMAAAKKDVAFCSRSWRW
jgi:hypothetical protein